MVSEIDVYRLAHQVIRTYGEGAELHAAMRSDELLARGDLDGARVWRRCLNAIKELQSTERPPGATSH